MDKVSPLEDFDADTRDPVTVPVTDLVPDAGTTDDEPTASHNAPPDDALAEAVDVSSGHIDEDFAAVVAELRAWCQDAGIHVGPDDLLDGKNAAALLGISEGSMRNWRCCYGERIPSVRRGRRVYYRLEDLAAALLGS